MHSKKFTIVSGIAVVAWCAFIFVMSAFPADESTQMSMGFVYQIVQLLPGYNDMDPAGQIALQEQVDHVVRKLAHFSEYAMLGLLALNFARCVAKKKRGTTANTANAAAQPLVGSKRLLATTWALATCYAVTDEVHQIFVPGRSCMVTDVCIDSAGVVAGMLVFAAICAIAARRRIAKKKRTLL